MDYFNSYHNAVGSTGHIHQKFHFFQQIQKRSEFVRYGTPKFHDVSISVYHKIIILSHQHLPSLCFLAHPLRVYGGFLSHGGTPRSFQSLDHVSIETPGDLGGPKNGVPPKSSKIDYLVGGISHPLKYMISSVGMMTFPIYGKITNVPNRQPVIIGKPMVWGTHISHISRSKNRPCFHTGQGSKKPSRHSHRKVPASSSRRSRRLLRVSWPLAHF